MVAEKWACAAGSTDRYLTFVLAIAVGPEFVHGILLLIAPAACCTKLACSRRGVRTAGTAATIKSAGSPPGEVKLATLNWVS